MKRAPVSGRSPAHSVLLFFCIGLFAAQCLAVSGLLVPDSSKLPVVPLPDSQIGEWARLPRSSHLAENSFCSSLISFSQGLLLPGVLLRFLVHESLCVRS